jgi:hypothetical protein
VYLDANYKIAGKPFPTLRARAAAQCEVAPSF